MRIMEDMKSTPRHLHTLFLSKEKIVKKGDHSMRFLLHVKIIPQYQIEKDLWFDDYFEGRAIFDEDLIFKVGEQTTGVFSVTYKWNWQGDTQPTDLDWLPIEHNSTEREARIPFSRPDIEREFIIRVDTWE